MDPAYLRCPGCPTGIVAARELYPICRHGGTADGKAQARHTPGWPLDGVRPADGRHKRRHLHRTGQPPRSAPADQGAADAAERQPSARPARTHTFRRFRARLGHPATPGHACIKPVGSGRAGKGTSKYRSHRGKSPARLAHEPVWEWASARPIARHRQRGTWNRARAVTGGGRDLPHLPLGFPRGPGSASRLTCTPGWP